MYTGYNTPLYHKYMSAIIVQDKHSSINRPVFTRVSVWMPSFSVCPESNVARDPSL